MSEKTDRDRAKEALFEGLDQGSVDSSAVLSALKETPLDYLGLLRESAAFLKQLISTETPSEPEEIKSLTKSEVVFATQRANFFEKLRLPALNEDQLENLLLRTHELWGEYPTEPLGRWVDWCLWTHLNRRQEGVPITEVIAGDKTATDLKQAWVDRHQSREERRQLQKIDNYERYDAPEDVPPSVRQLLMSPFIETEELAEIESEQDTATQEETRIQ